MIRLAPFTGVMVLLGALAITGRSAVRDLSLRAADRHRRLLAFEVRARRACWCCSSTSRSSGSTSCFTGWCCRRAWTPAGRAGATAARPEQPLMAAAMLASLAVVLVLGVWIPSPLNRLLHAAATRDRRTGVITRRSAPWMPTAGRRAPAARRPADDAVRRRRSDPGRPRVAGDRALGRGGYRRSRARHGSRIRRSPHGAGGALVRTRDPRSVRRSPPRAIPGSSRSSGIAPEEGEVRLPEEQEDVPLEHRGAERLAGPGVFVIPYGPVRSGVFRDRRSSWFRPAARMSPTAPSGCSSSGAGPSAGSARFRSS